MKNSVRVLETRTRPDGLRSRRYLMPDGRRVLTLELPASVVRSVGLQRVREMMARWLRGEDQRSDSRGRRVRIETLLRQGDKPTAIAHEVGVSDSYVRQVRKGMGL